MRHSSLGKVTLVSLALAFAAVGCENSNDKGRVIDQDQKQTTTPDGTQQRTRTQVRETPTATVQETQTEERKAVPPGQPADASRP